MFLIDTDIKQQLSSLFYVRKLVETQLRRLSEGSVDTDSTGMPTVSILAFYSKIDCQKCYL